MTTTLEDRLKGTAMPWIPDPEKAKKFDRDSCQLNPLIGVAVDHFRRLNFRGDGEYDCIVLNVEGVGDVAVHCQATVLASQMHAARPKPGEKVGVIWNGEKTGSSGTSYTDYRVVVEREPSGDFNWADGGSHGEFHTQPPEPEEQKNPAAKTDEDYSDIPF